MLSAHGTWLICDVIDEEDLGIVGVCFFNFSYSWIVISLKFGSTGALSGVEVALLVFVSSHPHRYCKF